MGVWYSRVELGNIDFLIKIFLSEKVVLKVGCLESELVSLLGIFNRLYIIVVLLVREEEWSKIGWKLWILLFFVFYYRLL